MTEEEAKKLVYNDVVVFRGSDYGQVIYNDDKEVTVVWLNVGNRFFDDGDEVVFNHSILKYFKRHLTVHPPLAVVPKRNRYEDVLKSGTGRGTGFTALPGFSI